MTPEQLLHHYYPDSEPLAVIGHACRFPEAGNSDAFWANLLAGRACNRHFSRQQLLEAGTPAALIDDPAWVPWGTVLEDAEMFDAELFGYSRQEAELIDPQQRLFLQIAWHALEHAGYAPGSVTQKTGVFAASRISTYPGREPLKLAEVAHVRSLQSLMGNDKDYVATRVAHKLDLRGPAISVQTACSSSLVAIHMACESLRAGECDMAIAGGVAVSFPQIGGYLWQQGMIFSPDGQCRPFDADAQGTFAGNGVAAVVLRRLADALRDGDPIVAVVSGSAVNNDGSQKVGYTAPSVAGQREVIADAWSLAGVTSQQIGMVEAHGTATPLGDPIELQALHGVFHAAGEGPACALGSVKSNLGHLDTAAGIASFLKAVMAVSHGTIPPSIHFSTANPALHLEQGPFFVPTGARRWDDAVRMAGVSSFGIGGTNCHMVVSSLPGALRQHAENAPPLQDSALLLSANSETALRQLAADYARALQRQPVADVVHTALHGRAVVLNWRLAVPVCAESADALAAFAAGEEEILVQCGQGAPGKQVWLFTGQGSQWPAMAQSGYAHSPAFAAALEHCLAVFDSDGDYQHRLRSALLDGAAFTEMALVQPAIVAFELAMAAHWQAHGLLPDLVSGHSVGEFAAAVVAGHYSADQILPLMRLRGTLMDRCTGGAMLAVFASEAETLPLAQQLGLDLAVCNGERHLVFSGAQAAVQQMAATLEQSGIRSHRLQVTGAAHSRMLDPILDEFQQACLTLQAQEGRLPLISGLTGATASAAELNHPTFWRRHMRNPVHFIQCLRGAVADGATLFVEMGPDASLSGIGQRELPEAACWIASARRHQPAPALLRQAVMSLFTAGVSLPWAALLPAGGRKCHAPLYPFARQRYWREAAADAVSQTDAAPVMLPAARRMVEKAGAELELPRLQQLYLCVIHLHAIYVDRLVRRCVGDAIDQGVSALTILRGGRLLPRHRQLLVRLLNACVEDGWLRRDGERYLTHTAAPHADCPSLLAELKSCCEGLDVIAETVQRAGENLYAMMSGEVEPVAVIFPEGASSGVEVLYQDFSFGRYFNQIAAAVVSDLLRQRDTDREAPSPYRVLEVGGGTGGTTAWVLPALQQQSAVHYTFSDISPLFTRRAAEKFAAYDFVSYDEFDLQKPAGEQGFAAGSYDLIVAANVIHATRHVGETLANLLPLLKPGGKLLMREITRPMRLFDFVFGPLVLPLHDESARGGELFLSTARWREQCLAAGFARVEWLPEDGSRTADISEHIVLATAPGAEATHGSLPLAKGVLGLPLSNDGSYLADWSDCAGQQAACAEMARRHGNGQSVALPTAVSAAPAWLNLVRLQWQAAPLTVPQIELRLCHPDGRWQRLSTDSEALTLSAAPETHYQWQWQPVTQAVAGENHRGETCRLAGNTVGPLAAALLRAGVAAPQATGTLLVLSEADHDLTSAARALLSALNNSEERRVVLVTQSAWSPDGGEAINPRQHALWGLVRTAAIELARQDRCIAAIDLTAAAGWQELVLGLQAINGGESGVAVRQGQLWLPRLVQQPWSAPALHAASLGDGWHVITGGLGGLGRLSARWLISRGARRIALLVQREHADSEAFIAELQRTADCTVLCLRCDVACPQALGAALNRLDADGGIAGVIHAADVLDDGPVSALTAERLAAVLAVKATAAATLHDYLSNRAQPAWLLLYSSAAATLGSAGQAAHALASAYLDGLALAASDGPLRVISVAWGAWGESGQAAQREVQQRLAAEGMALLSDAEGLWHLEQAISRAARWRLAMRVDAAQLDSLRQRLFVVQHAALPVPQAAAAVSRPPAARELSPERLSDTATVAAWLTVQIAGQLRLDSPERLAPTRDLVQLGLDSLLFLELSSTIQRRLGVRIDAEQAYADLTVNGLSRLIASQSAADQPQNDIAPLAHDAAGRYQPFPLTPVQHAYWMGRTSMIDYGGVACHVLFEWDLDYRQFDPARFEQAWNALVGRHDMLRMVIDDNGLQRILPEVPEYRLVRHDLRDLTPQQRQQALERTRQTLSYRVLPADRWPLFELVASEWDSTHYRLHMHLDLLLFDVQSFKVMMDDLAAFCRGDNPPPLQITFRDYVLDQQAQRLQPAWLGSWCWWQTLLSSLPPAPALPLSPQPAQTQPHFTTWQQKLNAEQWGRLKQAWQRWDVTPSAALMTLFAATLSRWARWPAFTLNLTFFNRRQVHPQMQQLIGDFTSVLLIDFDLADDALSLRDAIEQTQLRLRQRLGHSEVNGVELLRELGRLRGQSRQPLMPVVFTSMLGMTLDGLPIDQAMTSLLGDPVHVFTQTPQVWLDHQVMEIDGELVFSWYCMDEVLADGTAEAMFNDFHQLLLAVAENPALMSQTPRRTPAPAGLMPPRWQTTIAGQSVDLAALEQAARQQPGVALAAARYHADAAEIRVSVAAAEQHFTVDDCPALAPQNLPLQGLDAAQQANFDAVWHGLETLALHGIAMTLVKHGLFTGEGQQFSLAEVWQRLAVLPQFERLVRQWLRALSDAGWLTQQDDRFLCRRALQQVPPPSSVPSSAWGDALTAYLDRSIARHSELLQGSCSALELFFVDDHAVTRSLYADNPAARCVAENVRQMVAALVAGAHRKVAGAHRKVAGAHRKVAGAHRKVAGAHRKVAGAHRKVAGAHRKVAGAHRKVADAHREAAGAQRAATDAHREATDTHREATDGQREATNAHHEAADAHCVATDAHRKATDAHHEATDGQRVTTQADADICWRVLEVGAGTGATTGAVLAGLGEQRHRYHYTDVSTLFLDDARTRFASRDDMDFGLFDINQPVDYGQHPAEGYDLVVAAQVMHDASHIVRSLKRLASLMKPGGRLLLIEATHRDSQLQMASVGFIEGLGNYQDYRLLEDRAMLNLAQWQEALQQAGFTAERAWPEQSLSPLHQHVIVATMTRAAKIDCAALEQALHQQFTRLPAALKVVQREPLDLFTTDDSTAGVETQSAPTVADRPAADAEDGAADEQLIHEVGQIWQSLLGRPVSQHTDFFRSGGDSLIATRAIARLNRKGIAGASLQALFTHPVLARFCATLDGRRQAANPVLVPLTTAGSPASAPVLVCHASDGGVASYLPFAQALGASVWGLQAPETVDANSLTALAESYLPALDELPDGSAITLVGWSYGASVAALLSRLLHQRGTEVRLVLIDPVCGSDFRIDSLSELMGLLLQERQVPLPEGWAGWTQTGQIAAFSRCAQAAGLTARPLSAEAAEAWLTRIFRLLTLLAQHQPEPVLPVPLLWIEASQRPPHWSQPEQQWAEWKQQSRCHVVSATHWQLMDQPERAGELASLVRKWSETSCKEEKQ